MKKDDIANPELKKSKKRLFKPLSEKAPSSPEKGIELPKMSPRNEDLKESDKKLEEKWKSLKEKFKDIDGFDSKTIANYGKGEQECMTDKYVQACSYFDLFLKMLIPDFESFSDSLFKEDLFKIFLATFQRICAASLALILKDEEAQSEIKDLLGKRQILNDFLILTTHDGQNSMVLFKYDFVLLEIVKSNINQILGIIGKVPRVKIANQIALLLFYNYESLGILASFHEGKSSVNDLIKRVHKDLEQSLRASLDSASLKETYSVLMGETESWMTEKYENKFVSVRFNRKKITLMKYSKQTEKPIFSLRYVNLYYASRLAQILAEKGLLSNEEKTLETIGALLINISEYFSDMVINNKTDCKTEIVVESLLNESFVCFKIIMSAITKSEDRFLLLEKLGYSKILKNIVENILKVTFMFRLQKMPSDKEDLIINFSYKQVKDYVADLFNFLAKLRNPKIANRVSRESIKGAKSIAIIEDIMTGIVEILDAVAVKVRREEILPLKMYIVEYHCDNLNAISKKTAERIIKLLESNTFHLTSPESMSMISDKKFEEESEKVISRGITATLNHIISYDKIWAEAIIKHLVEQVSPLFEYEEKLFGLYKLIYCTLTNESMDNLTFYAKLFGELQQLTLKPHQEVAKEDRNRALLAFIEKKGVLELMKMLDDIYMSLKEGASKYKETSIRLTERFILILQDIPSISEQLFRHPMTTVKLLEYSSLSPKIHSVVVACIQRLLSSIKFSKTNSAVIIDKETYLPLRLLDFIKTQANNKDQNSIEMILPFLELLVNFLTPEPGAPSLQAAQSTLNSSLCVSAFFSILQNNKHSPLIGETMILFLRFINGLLYKNDIVTSDIIRSHLISKKILYKFIKDEINRETISKKDIEEILRIFLDISFDCRTDLSKPSIYILKRKMFLSIYLHLLCRLALDQHWFKRVLEHIKYICDVLRGSYLNSLCCSSTLFKLAKLVYQDFDSLKCIMSFVAEVANVNISSQDLRAFIGQLSNSELYVIENKTSECSRNYVLLILDSLIRMLSSSKQKIVFAFNGKPNSGVGLVAQEVMPKDGYCFCGWIRVERPDQSNEGQNEKMCIFKLTSSKNKEMEFFVKDGYLNYSVNKFNYGVDYRYKDERASTYSDFCA